MNDDEIVTNFREAVAARAELAERNHAKGLPLTPEDITAVALAHPDSYEVQVRLRPNPS